MLKRDRRRDVPRWLNDIKLEKPSDLEAYAFPLEKAIEHSLYYPAAGGPGDITDTYAGDPTAECDGDPVKFLGGFIHSFFYVDYRASEKGVDDEAFRRGFLGYRIAGRKQLSLGDLAPNGWEPAVPQKFEQDKLSFQKLRHNVNWSNPFATWYVFDRDSYFEESHGPKRFSLVFICADGVATYQALYWPNKTAPEVLAVIQPGHAFGFNYTDFTNPDGFFSWTVMIQAQTPEYLICGGMGNNYPKAFWPDEFPEHIEDWHRKDGGGGIWRRKKATMSRFLRATVEKLKLKLGFGRRRTSS